MLRAVFFVHTSGLLLHYKEFDKSVIPSQPGPGMLAGVIIAMQKFSSAKTGLPVAWIELGQGATPRDPKTDKGVALAIIRATSFVTCALCVDRKDGQYFAQLIAQQLLAGFLKMFHNTLEERMISDRDVFKPFNSKIAEIIRNSVVPVLEKLQRERGIQTALLTTGDQVRSPHGLASHHIDAIGVLANHQALFGKATDIMSCQNDVPLFMTIKGPRTTVCLQRIRRSSLIVVYKNGVDADHITKVINKAAELLTQVLIVAASLKDIIKKL